MRTQPTVVALAGSHDDLLHGSVKDHSLRIIRLSSTSYIYRNPAVPNTNVVVAANKLRVAHQPKVTIRDSRLSYRAVERIQHIATEATQTILEPNAKPDPYQCLQVLVGVQGHSFAIAKSAKEKAF